MKYGVCNWTYGEEPIEKTLDRLSKYGYDGVELIGEPADYDVVSLRGALAEGGLEVLNIGAKCNWPTEERDLANPDPDVRERAVQYYRSCLDLAYAVGSPLCGLIPSAVGRLGPLTSYTQEWTWAVEAAKRVADYAEERGIIVVIEPINRYEAFLVNTAEQAIRFIRDVESVNLALMLDTFHMNIDEADVADAFRESSCLLRHVHFADSNREGLGCGHIQFGEIVRALQDIEYNGAIVIEATAPGPNPFHPIKDELSRYYLEGFTRDSIRLMKSWFR